MTPPPFSAEVLNRLLIGRELLKSFGPNLTAQSDALSVARAILTAQDASELITSAIAEQILAQPKDKGGLPEYIDTIEKKSSTPFPGKSFFNALNRARVSFKHHGALPNVPEFHQVLPRAEDHLDQACMTYIGISLSDLDLSLLIASVRIRSLYIDAQDQARHGKYREALETLANGIAELSFEAPMYLGSGDKDSETALQLTAYGVDPGAFIRMQQFLPRVGLESEAIWDTRNHGHPGNWRKPNVAFCLATFLDLVLKLQHAQYQPSAVEFSFLFQDVVTAKRDGVPIQSQYYHELFGSVDWGWKEFGELKIGQCIKGRLVPAFQSGTSSWEETAHFQTAELYIIKQPRLDSGPPVPENTVLIVKAQDVDWSYEEREGVRGHMPRYFEPDE